MFDTPRRAAPANDEAPPRRSFGFVDDDDAPRRGLGYADEGDEDLYDDDQYADDLYADDQYADDDGDPVPARGLGFLEEEDSSSRWRSLGEREDAYAWSPATDSVWADVWATDPYAPVPDAPTPPRNRGLWRPRLTVVTAAAAVMVAGIPAAIGVFGNAAGTATAAVAPPALPLITSTPEPAPTPQPTVEAPAAPLVQPPAPAPMLPAPQAPRPVTGIPQPCSVDLPFPATGSLSAHVDRMQRQWSFQLAGAQWRDERYRPIVKIFSETMDAVDCTDYLDRVKAGNGGRLEINSGSTRSWAWGDYGLTRAGVLTLDFTKFLNGYNEGDRGRLVRLIVHEMAHSLNADRGGEPAYWQRFHGVWQANGKPTDYGSTETEAFADAVGYYVARCAAENPYADAKKTPYYDYVKKNIFGGQEFGGPVATRQVCDGEGR
ncbi:hypothetical protein [Mariniluteicoccus flavus]